MNSKLLILLTIFMVGCGKGKAGFNPVSVWSRVTPGPKTAENKPCDAWMSSSGAMMDSCAPSSPEGIIAAWRAKAKAKRLYWSIQCTASGDGFLGEAWEHPGDDAFFVEEGGKPTWLALGVTQADTAAKLLAKIDLPPNFTPESRTENARKEREKHKMCPPPLVGSPDPIFDSQNAIGTAR